MAGLIYFDTNVYTGEDALFAALQNIPNFWDEISEESTKRLLVKGDVTIEISQLQTKGVYGYGKAFTVPFEQETTYIIAATANGLIFDVGGYSGHSNGIALGIDDNGIWGAAKLNTSSSSASVTDVLAPNTTATTFSYGSIRESSTITQITDLISDKGNFIFKDLCRVAYTPTAVNGYKGRLTMPNGEKYVKVGGAALRYT